jgi:hypothetical protein
VEELSDSDSEYENVMPAVVGGATSPSPFKGKAGSGMNKRGKQTLFNGERQRTTSSSSDHGLASFYEDYVGADPSRLDVSTIENSSNDYFSAYGEEDSDSDGDETVVYTAGEMARLLSLNEQDMLCSDDSADEEEGKGAVKKGATGSPKKSPRSRRHRQDEGEVLASPVGAGGKQVTTSTHKIRLEPVGVFWDIENCPVPVEKSAFGVAAKMRHEFIEGKREAEFMCVCDITKERKEITDDLNKAQVSTALIPLFSLFPPSLPPSLLFFLIFLSLSLSRSL